MSGREEAESECGRAESGLSHGWKGFAVDQGTEDDAEESAAGGHETCWDTTSNCVHNSVLGRTHEGGRDGFGGTGIPGKDLGSSHRDVRMFPQKRFYSMSVMIRAKSIQTHPMMDPTVQVRPYMANASVELDSSVMSPSDALITYNS